MTIEERLAQLVDTFRRDVELATRLESSNPQDDLCIKVAAVGFSYNCPTQEWSKGHYEFVTTHLNRNYYDDELSHYGRNAENVKLFVALCIGYLLGLFQSQMIDDTAFKQAEILVPGLVMLHLPKLAAEGLPG